jgi:putative hemolysin
MLPRPMGASVRLRKLPEPNAAIDGLTLGRGMPRLQLGLWAPGLRNSRQSFVLGGLVPSILIVMFLLLIGSAYFSGSEAALFSLSRLQLHRLAARRDRASRRVSKLLEDPSKTLTTLLVGNNLVNIALSAIATYFFLTLLRGRHEGEAVRVATLVVTLAVLLVGEITPKTLAVNHNLATARWTSGILVTIAHVLAPLSQAMHALSLRVLRWVPGGQGIRVASASLISRAELHALLEDVDSDAAVITRNESRMVQNILGFSKRTAEQIMTPRVDVLDVDLASPRDEVIAMLRETRHSRYPAYRQDPDDVLGFVSAKEFLLNPERDPAEILRPILFMPEPAPVSRVFSEMQRAQTAMVVVVNEFGEMVGIITREDVIEEIVGDIYDEFDLEEAPIRKRGEGLFIVSGRTDLADLNADLHLNLPDESAVTLNGFLCEVHGRIPPVGAVIEWEGVRFHVLEVARHQIRKVLVEIQAAEESGEKV